MNCARATRHLGGPVRDVRPTVGRTSAANGGPCAVRGGHDMERLTKGALAIGAGALLLLGGAGTYAL